MAGRKQTEARKASPTKPESVEAFLDSLEPQAKQQVLAMRNTILSADPRISEGIKWNVLSFRTTEHFATVNIRLKSGLGVILHFGAKKNAISTSGVTISDPGSLLVWLARDRAMVTFRDLDDLAAKQADFQSVLREWIEHI